MVHDSIGSLLRHQRLVVREGRIRTALAHLDARAQAAADGGRPVSPALRSAQETLTGRLADVRLELAELEGAGGPEGASIPA